MNFLNKMKWLNLNLKSKIMITNQSYFRDLRMKDHKAFVDGDTCTGAYVCGLKKGLNFEYEYGFSGLTYEGS